MEQKDVNVKKDNLYVGIDLGTSNSVVMASNGRKESVDSYVGWPKDFVSAKFMKKPISFGKEALENRLSLDLYRPLEHGVIKEGTEKEEEAVRELIKYLISLVRPEKHQSIKAVVGVPAESFKVNRQAIIKAISGFVHSVMVVSEPFAVAYGINQINNSMVVDIGAGTIDFCIMHGTIPSEDDQRSILTAGDHIDKTLEKMLREKFPESTFNRNMIRQFKESFSHIGNGVPPVAVNIPIKGKPIAHDITGEMRKSCESILPPIVETMTDMIAKFDPEYQEKIRNNVWLAGCGSQIRGLTDYIQRMLSEYSTAQVRAVQNPIYAGAEGALQLAQEMPKKYWDKLSIN